MAFALCSIVMILFSEGIGRWLFKVIKYEPQNQVYAAPYGAALVFCVLEVLYLPIMVCHGSFRWILGASMLVVIGAMIPFLMTWKETLKTIFRARSLYILLAGSIIAGIFLRYGLKDMLLDTELLQMSSYVNSASLTFDAMPLQGYPLFGSVAYWVCNMNAETTVLFLGLFTSTIGMMMSLNFVDSFQLPNPWLRFTLISFLLFYCTFYSWKIVGSFHAANWRLLLTGLAIYTAYQWLRTGKENIKYLIPIVLGAGFFVHSAFLLIAIEILYCIAVFLFSEQKIRSLYDLTTFMIPVVLYLCYWLGEISPWLGWILAILYLLFLNNRSHKKTYHKIIQVEDFIIAYNKRIFWVIIPVIFLIGTFVLRFFVSGYGVEYSSYLNYFSHRTVAGFLFPRGNIIDIIMDVWRWAGVFFFALKAFTKEDRMMRALCICMILFFLNPLCMGMIVQISGIETYASAFEILFNPFTDVLVFVAIYKMFEWTVLGQWVLELCLVCSVLLGHIASYTNLPIMGLYDELITEDNIYEVEQP